MASAVVIGGGVGGLSAALRLAAAGVKTTLVERSDHLGGKLRTLTVGEHEVPAGPTVTTMPWVFEELFAAAGARLDDHVRLRRIDPIARHVFADGSVLDLHSDEQRSAAAIERFAGAREAEGYLRFRRYCARIYDAVVGPFMRRPPPKLGDFFSLRALREAAALTKIDAMRSMWSALGDFFEDPRLTALFGRYATYVGSNPTRAPATLHVIAHVEAAFGVHAVEGGFESLPRAIAARFVALGGEVRLRADAARVLVSGGGVTGVELADGERLGADVVVFGGEPEALERMLGATSVPPRSDPSLSAFLVLAVAEGLGPSLAHHTVFFPERYLSEHEDLFDRRRTPRDPTVYVCARDRGASDSLPPAKGERLLLLTNAPGGASFPTSEDQACRTLLLETLARRGLPLSQAITAERIVTPRHWAALHPESGGSIYGQAQSSPWAALQRPSNAHPKVKGLYRVGGSTHPGAGVPMVALSADIAVTQALAELSTSRRSTPFRRATDTPGGT